MRRSSRKPRWQSSARARPRSASSERSWNSSNSTAPMPESSGSSRIMRVKTPSVTTSMRVFGPDFETIRARNPIRSPTASDKECAMRSAAARAAMRRGSSTRIFRPWSQLSFIKASGTRVVLPAPGGATRTADAHAARALRTSSRTASIGSGGVNFMRLYRVAASVSQAQPAVHIGPDEFRYRGKSGHFLDTENWRQPNTDLIRFHRRAQRLRCSPEVKPGLVRTAGVEPGRRCRLRILSPVCLPVPPRPRRAVMSRRRTLCNHSARSGRRRGAPCRMAPSSST